jgi:hypothetical protein
MGRGLDLNESVVASQPGVRRTPSSRNAWLGYLWLDGALSNPDSEELCVSIVNTDVFGLAKPSKLAKINKLFSMIDMSH